MARKMGLNIKEQAQAYKWLKEGIKAADIAKKFKTTEEIINRFTPEKQDAAKAKAAERNTFFAKKKVEDKKKADIVQGVLDNMKDDTPDDFS